jgi:hypothetical protein
MEVIQMTNLWKRGWRVAALIVAGATFAMAEPTGMPRPGLINTVQGQVSLDEHPVLPHSMRRQVLRAGQEIRTNTGKAELLLTPGSFLRIGNNAEVRMLSRSLENTQVKVVQGTALLDAKAGYKHALAIIMDGTTTRIEKHGIYGFNATGRTISVLRGKAIVYQGDSQIRLKKGRQLYVAARGNLQVARLDKQAFKSSSLYQWNQVRDRYESRARRSVQRWIAQSGRWYGPGWYPSRFWGFYAYVPSPGPFIGPYYGPYYGPWGWNDWGWGWGGGWGDDDD